MCVSVGVVFLTVAKTGGPSVSSSPIPKVIPFLYMTAWNKDCISQPSLQRGIDMWLSYSQWHVRGRGVGLWLGRSSRRKGQTQLLPSFPFLLMTVLKGLLAQNSRLCYSWFIHFKAVCWPHLVLAVILFQWLRLGVHSPPVAVGTKRLNCAQIRVEMSTHMHVEVSRVLLSM